MCDCECSQDENKKYEMQPLKDELKKASN